MIGAKIALTALIIFAVCVTLTFPLKKTKGNMVLKSWLALVGFTSLAAIPVGMIISIWSYHSG